MAAEDFKSIYGRNLTLFTAAVGAAIGFFYLLPHWNDRNVGLDKDGNVTCGDHLVRDVGCTYKGQNYTRDEWVEFVHSNHDDGVQDGWIALGLLGGGAVAWYSINQYNEAQKKREEERQQAKEQDG